MSNKKRLNSLSSNDCRRFQATWTHFVSKGNYEVEQRESEEDHFYASPQSTSWEREWPMSYTHWVPDTKHSDPPGELSTVLGQSQAQRATS